MFSDITFLPKQYEANVPPSVTTGLSSNTTEDMMVETSIFRFFPNLSKRKADDQSSVKTPPVNGASSTVHVNVESSNASGTKIPRTDDASAEVQVNVESSHASENTRTATSLEITDVIDEDLFLDDFIDPDL